MSDCRFGVSLVNYPDPDPRNSFAKKCDHWGQVSSGQPLQSLLTAGSDECHCPGIDCWQLLSLPAVTAGLCSEQSMLATASSEKSLLPNASNEQSLLLQINSYRCVRACACVHVC